MDICLFWSLEIIVSYNVESVEDNAAGQLYGGQWGENGSENG